MIRSVNTISLKTRRFPLCLLWAHLLPTLEDNLQLIHLPHLEKLNILLLNIFLSSSIGNCEVYIRWDTEDFHQTRNIILPCARSYYGELYPILVKNCNFC